MAEVEARRVAQRTDHTQGGLRVAFSCGVAKTVVLPNRPSNDRTGCRHQHNCQSIGARCGRAGGLDAALRCPSRRAASIHGQGNYGEHKRRSSCRRRRLDSRVECVLPGVTEEKRWTHYLSTTGVSRSSIVRASDSADAIMPVGTATTPSPTIKTRNVNTRPPTVTG